MQASPNEPALPTLDRLNVVLPENLNSVAIASRWADQFAHLLKNADTIGIADLFIDDSFWRDTLALTWDFRTFHGTKRITRFLEDVLVDPSPSTDKQNDGRVAVSNLSLDETSVQLQKPYPDLAWVQGQFSFETAVGICSGVFRLVPTSLGLGSWKAHVVYTSLEELKGRPELIGPRRSTASNHGDDWLAERQQEESFENTEPIVVVVGAGHCGLEAAARLKYLGVPALVVDRHQRIGDSWRIRYEVLSLHDPVYIMHMPYFPFPCTWPIWTPSPKIADWLEYYAKVLELNVWTGTNVEKIEEGGLSDEDVWRVHVTRSNGSRRTLRPKHVIFATGIFGGPPRIPKFPGMENFKGKIVHTMQYKSAKEHLGKKVVIIGACTSGHDVAQDHGKHGIDVTMVQRGSTYIMSTKYGVTKFNKALYWEGTPPVEVSDRIAASFPNLLTKRMHQRQAPVIVDMDKELLDGLNKRGFKFNMGEDGSGVIMLYLRRGGGFYFDTGASQMIIDGKIKLKNDSEIARFTGKGIEFQNGTSLSADVVILATGYESAKVHVASIVSEDIASRLNTLWGLNDEGELNSVFRDSGVPRLYFAMGNFSQSRYYSKLLALQIKAQEEGLLKNRYNE